MAENMKGKPFGVVAVSDGQVLELHGTVLDVRDGALYLMVADEACMSPRPRDATRPRGKWEGVNMRAFFRLPVNTACTVGRTAPDSSCSLVNISGNGICFRCVDRFKPGDFVKLSVPLVRGKVFRFTAQIVRTRTYSGSILEYGAKLVGLSRQEESDLVAAIFQLQRPRKL